MIKNGNVDHAVSGPELAIYWKQSPFKPKVGIRMPYTYKFKPTARKLNNKIVDKVRTGKTLTLSEQSWLARCDASSVLQHAGGGLHVEVSPGSHHARAI